MVVVCEVLVVVRDRSDGARQVLGLVGSGLYARRLEDHAGADQAVV